MTKKDVVSLIKNDEWMMGILREVEKLNLPDWWIGAGFVRSKVWDHLHGYKKRTPLPDIDVVYFDPKSPKSNEQKYWKILKGKFPDQKWSITNTAYRHLRIGRKESYLSSTEALSDWVETATGVGVSINRGMVKLTAPNRIDDLVNMVLRPTKNYEKRRKVFEKRIKEKKWLEKWPKLTIAK